MSGGEFNYIYLQIENIANRAEMSENVERLAFRNLLLNVAKALRSIEWSVSGDGDDNESLLIRRCLSKCDVLDAAIREAEGVMQALAAEITMAKLCRMMPLNDKN